MSFADSYAESTNPALQGRVQMATGKTAQAVGSEAETEPNHANRANLATQVARFPGQYTVPFTSMLCAQGITDDSTDAEIESMISAVWNTMAGPPPPTAPTP